MQKDGGDDGEEDDSYEPEYEVEEIVVYKDVRFRVLTVLPPPLEFLATLHQDRNEISGRTVWTGSLLLARFLCHQISNGSLSLDALRVLELGCGTGLLGMCLARLDPLKQKPSCVVLTDGDDEALELLNQNLVNNGFHANEDMVAVTKLLWGDDDASVTNRFIDTCRTSFPFWDDDGSEVTFDCIVAGDVLYKADLPDVFFTTVNRFLSPSGTVWLCHVPRASVSHDVVSDAIQRAGFHVIEKHAASAMLEVEEDMGAGCPPDDVQRAIIYRITRRVAPPAANESSEGTAP